MEDGEYSNISLRIFEISDVDDLLVWASDEKVTKFCTWEPYTSREDALNYIKDTVIPHPWYRAICLNNRAVGSIALTKNSSGIDACRGELGYVVAYKYWGNGIATRAVKMAAKSIFSDCPHLERLEALVDVGNLGSQRVLEKAGFTIEGVLRKYLTIKGRTRDMVIFRLLVTDPVL